MGNLFLSWSHIGFTVLQHHGTLSLFLGYHFLKDNRNIAEISFVILAKRAKGHLPRKPMLLNHI